jgi:hypothetical protein
VADSKWDALEDDGLLDSVETEAPVQGNPKLHDKPSSKRSFDEVDPELSELEQIFPPSPQSASSCLVPNLYCSCFIFLLHFIY